MNLWIQDMKTRFHNHDFICYVSWPMNSDMGRCSRTVVVITSALWIHVYEEYREIIPEIMDWVPRLQMCRRFWPGSLSERDILYFWTWISDGHCSSLLPRPRPPATVTVMELQPSLAPWRHVGESRGQSWQQFKLVMVFQAELPSRRRGVQPARSRPSRQWLLSWRRSPGSGCLQRRPHLEGWDVLYNTIFCYIANILLHNRNLFGYVAFNLMLYSTCYITYAT